MITQPVLPEFLIVILVLVFGGLAVWALVRAKTASTRMLWVARIGLVLACGLLLLRPGVPGGAVETLASDVDIVLMVDTTASMVAEDWDGDEERMAGVREDVRALVEAYPGARFALLTFDAARKKDAGERSDLDAGMAKLFATEIANESALEK